jgi:uncharacterized membrane protein
MAREKAKKSDPATAATAVRSTKGVRLAGAVAAIVLACLLCAASLQSMLGSTLASGALASHGLTNRASAWLGAEPAAPGSESGAPAARGEPALPPFTPIFLLLTATSAVTWLAGAWWISRRRHTSFLVTAATWGLRGWLWWLVGGSWELARLVAFASGSAELQSFVLSSDSFWIAAGLAGWIATFLSLAFFSRARGALTAAADPDEGRLPAPPALATGSRSIDLTFRDDYRVPVVLWLCFAAYVVAFVAMNWQLYRSLRLPHGDSAMYEEHLWNLLHGKGFRSYLDQGLFLGEHVQVIHLLLIPLYVLWPSQLLLELCDSVLLGACCVPVYWMARRHTGHSRPAVWLAAATLLYFPLQYLDIGIDWKTFRPNGLGIPALLFALDQLERRRSRSFCLLAAVALSAQEDYAIVLAPLGVWIALTLGFSAWGRQRFDERATGDRQAAAAPATIAATPGRVSHVNWRGLALGAGLAVFSAIYLVVATRVVMAYFRHGQEIHYAGYFTKFGKTMPEIAKNMATRWDLLREAFVNAHTAEYALMLVAPLGFLPLFSAGRLAVALPLFLTLCLNEVIDSPLHHVHAAAVPILLWAAAAGLGTIARGSLAPKAWREQAAEDVERASAERRAGWWGRFAAASALATGVFFGLSPLSIGFWDPDSGFYWRDHYVVGKRAELFERVLREIPPSARVASTDFIHPRFTHHDRSYDYSDYPRAVNNFQPGVPPDTDYIVIDTHGPYSKVERPQQVPEYRDHPDQWELLPDTTEGYFIVLKRKQARASG